MSSPTAPLLPSLFFLLASGTWFLWELYAQLAFFVGPGVKYDWKVESLSDLGVDYRQVHPLKHHNVQSFRYWAQNFNFAQAGVCFALAHVALLVSSYAKSGAGAGLVRTVRATLAVAYAVGLGLTAWIHGGPRETFWKIIGWHWMGLGTAAVAGAGTALVAAIAPGAAGAFERNPAYRGVSALLAGVGLYSYYRFLTLGTWNYATEVGLWQRGMIYPTLVWEAITAAILLGERFGRVEKSGKKKAA